MIHPSRPRLARGAILFGLLVGAAAGAQERPSAAVPESLRSPRATLDAFLGEQLRAEVDWEAVVATLDFDEGTAADERRQAASQLKSVLDGRGLFVRMDRIPADPEYLDPESREAVFAPFPIRLPDFEVRRGSDRAWRISSGTVRAAGALYEQTFSWYARRLLDHPSSNAPSSASRSGN